MITVISQPASEPITVDDAKIFLRVVDDAEDGLITSLIKNAREWAERYTRRAFVTQTYRLSLDEFPDGPAPMGNLIYLPGGPVASIDSIKYTDANGVEQTLPPSDYVLGSADAQAFAFVRPAFSKAWPGTRDEPLAVRIEYVVGYGAAAAVPELVKQAIRLHVSWHFRNRDTVADNEQFMHALEMKLADVRMFTFG